MEKYFTLQTDQWGQLCYKTCGCKGYSGGEAAPVTELGLSIVFQGQGGACVRQLSLHTEAALRWCHITLLGDHFLLLVLALLYPSSDSD